MGPSHEAADYAAAYPAYPVRTPVPPAQLDRLSAANKRRRGENNSKTDNDNEIRFSRTTRYTFIHIASRSCRKHFDGTVYG
jgi:hypothetical protein